MLGETVTISKSKLARIIALRPEIVDGRFVAPDLILRNRPNKIAMGMTKTVYRSCQTISASALTLSVKGTLDRLGGSRWAYVRTDPNTKKLRLSQAGKDKLRRLKGQGLII